ncbi:MAG: presenilin family intramembrane aspartyl protease [Nanoarchaeota archaeon]
MKHNLKITFILLGMFIVTQLIGLAVINAYTSKELPYGFQPPEMKPEVSFSSIIISFIIAIILIFLLMRIRATFFLRLWFFLVVVVALAITMNAVFLNFNFPYLNYLPVILALPLAFYKVFKRNLIVHNLTELLIYPGIAAVFVPILNLWAIVLLLLLISVYDIYAVWHAGFMQKMAMFQINQLKVFAGFFVPYLSYKQIAQMKKLKASGGKKQKGKKIRVSLAILGGGDVVFPIIMAGVVLRTLGLAQALIISVFATLALFFLFMAAKKGKSYPAMPFLTAGCLAGLVLAFLLSFI